MRIQHKREFYTPRQNAIKLTHKVSGRVVYISQEEHKLTGKTRYYAVGFLPKGQKPALNFYYVKPEHREKSVRDFFAEGAAKIERNAAWKAERKAEQEKLSGEVVARFEVGKTYTCRSLCDYDCIFKFKVVKRTEKTVWLEEHGEVKARRVRISAYDKCEACDPHGVYSMSPTLHAKNEAR